jgi:hypothetical protein
MMKNKRMKDGGEDTKQSQNTNNYMEMELITESKWKERAMKDWKEVNRNEVYEPGEGGEK